MISFIFSYYLILLTFPLKRHEKHKILLEILRCYEYFFLFNFFRKYLKILQEHSYKNITLFQIILQTFQNCRFSFKSQHIYILNL